MPLLEQKMITSSDDLVALEIIDWNRLNGTSSNMRKAIHDISSWFIGTSAYSILEHDLSHAPDRDDFPLWKHTGHTHESIARLYWNDFKFHFPTSELIFSDEPDFSGEFISPERSASFWGDIGTVSASAFALTTIRKMKKGDLWISIINDNQQIIIEALEDLSQLFQDKVITPLLGDPSPQKREMKREMKRT